MTPLPHMAPLQQMLANDPEPGADFPFLARGHSFDLLGDVVPVDFIGGAATQRACLLLGPGSNICIVKSVGVLISHRSMIAHGG